MNKPKTSRLYFLDNLKVFLTILVILHHVGQAYGPGGFWQYKSSLGEQVSWMASFFTVNAAFFMKLIFMISGYFLKGSYDRNSSAKYLSSKILRYGIPVIFALVVLQPLLMFFHYNNYSGNSPLGFWQYFKTIYWGIGGMPDGFISSIGFPELNFGHLWFVEHLLIYSLIYFIIRKIFKSKKTNHIDKTFRFIYIIIIAAIISALTAIIRIWFPIDYWFGLLGFIQVEPAHFPQYSTMFIVGIIAYKNNWFSRINNRQGYASLSLGLAMALLIYLRPVLPETFINAVYSTWVVFESFMAVFLCFGLIVLFREKFSSTNSLLKSLSSTAYLAYILHYPIVILVQYLLDKVVIINPTGKFITVSILSVVFTFTISYLIRKIKFLQKIV